MGNSPFFRAGSDPHAEQTRKLPYSPTLSDTASQNSTMVTIDTDGPGMDNKIGTAVYCANQVSRLEVKADITYTQQSSPRYAWQFNCY